ncbi:hypothetical protein MJO28_001692 [Puccinia striiformis f. sp. tritici]|uniref:Uncharacterized protein n=2 Tax=Puccinia striiformis TaxID=27350 RepID=A0A2S4VHY8_9BASI|nr:hypothetical protein MJO28_001692 [Puccinia striiformis f. sp. tritici]POW08980.1 hypothetical protein PSTT_07153 [Puccinia striiformis]
MDNIQLTASSAAMDNNQTNSASASAVLPKGILKNKPGQHDVMSLAHLTSNNLNRFGRSSIESRNTVDTDAAFLIFIISMRVGFDRTETNKGTDLDPDARAKHDAFVRARKGHYENEAEAMKKTRKLAEKDDIESDVAATSVEESEDLPSLPSSESQPNGA